MGCFHPPTDYDPIGPCVSCAKACVPTVFEETIIDICDTVHANGGQVYMDGANMNAQVMPSNCILCFVSQAFTKTPASSPRLAGWIVWPWLLRCRRLPSQSAQDVLHSARRWYPVPACPSVCHRVPILSSRFSAVATTSGGPGVGPIGVAEHLKPFMPTHPIISPHAGPGTSSGSRRPCRLRWPHFVVRRLRHGRRSTMGLCFHPARTKQK